MALPSFEVSAIDGSNDETRVSVVQASVPDSERGIEFMDEYPQCLCALKRGHDFPLLQVAERLRVPIRPPPAAGGCMVAGGGGDRRQVRTF